MWAVMNEVGRLDEQWRAQAERGGRRLKAGGGDGSGPWAHAGGEDLDRKKQKAGNEELQRALGVDVGRRGQAPGGRRRDEQTSRGRANGCSGL
jgi:hypothetical protein